MIYPEGFVAYCQSLNMRLTSLRKSILFILWHLDKPLKAYDILNALLQSKQNSKPSSVYRTLDYFVSLGIVHKIESLQSYTLCHDPKQKRSSEILMVCHHCHLVQEIHEETLIATIKQFAFESGFSLGQDVIELKGICNRCNT